MFSAMSLNLIIPDSDKTKYNEPVCTDPNAQSGSFYTNKTLVVGLTGSIATGKTTVSGMFKDLGAEVISADEIVHLMMKPQGEVWKAIVCEFGEGILNTDKTIDRTKLGGIVFKDAERRKKLESIIHPPVLRYLADEASRFRAENTGILILEIPLLIETSSQSIVDKLIVVAAEQNTQIKRLHNRYGISPEEAISRINAQLPLSEKIKHADFVINTDDSLSSTKEDVYRIWCTLQKSLAHPK